MTLTIDSGRLEVFEPTNQTNTPNSVIEPPDLRNVTVSTEVQDASGNATIAINNVDGRHAGEISTGDRLQLVVEVQTVGSSEPTRYGSGTYGAGSYGRLDGEQALWTGLAGIPRYAVAGSGTRSITVEGQPFAFGVMGSLGRKVDNAFRGRTVTDIAKTIINDEAAELDPSGIQTFDTVFNVEYDGRPLLDAMSELADVVDAVLTANGRTVIMKPLETIPVLFDATGDDFEGGWNVDPVDDALYNQVRIAGSVDNDVGDSQTTQTGYTTVTQNSPIMVQVQLEKSRTNQMDVWTRPTGSGEDYKVRVQEDIGGAPTDVTDSSKDLVNKTLSTEFIEQDGFTEFLLERTALPAPDPWLIVESGGDIGQDVGVNGSGVLTFKAYYHYPIITQESDQQSIEEYRRREKRVERKTITDATTASEIASSILRRSTNPQREFSTNAATRRAHDLQPTDVIELNFPADQAVGEYMVTTREDEYGPSGARQQLTTSLRLTEVKTF